MLDTSLTDEDKEYIYAECEGLDDTMKEKISSSIENGEVEKNDIGKVIARIKQLKETNNE